MKKIASIIMLVALMHFDVSGQNLEQSFRNPPDSAKPWVFWFWINGNISREGITKDLEAMKRVGINGVLWMEVSGPWWAPQGPIEAGTKEWDEMMQWAISEADRLGMDFDLSVDFGYGCGGPHITPETSMQKLVWSETLIEGGKPLTLKLKRPEVDYKPMLKKVWLRPGKQMDPEVIKRLEEIDSYRDIAVFAVRMSSKKATRIVDTELAKYDGRGWKTHLPELRGKEVPAPIPQEDIIDLTNEMGKEGKLEWSTPKGNWRVIRFGYASNFQMTRPCPHAAVGLECDRLHPRGMDAHFENHLKPILEAAGDKAGRTIQYIHIDSWEAYGQNWSAGFAEEFKRRRGYDIQPWLPVLMGNIVQSVDMTSRFLWDMRQTVSELMLENYIDRLRELLAAYGVGFSCESYGNFCVDNLSYGGRSDFPIAEFWTEKQINKIKTDDAPAILRQFIEPAKFDEDCYRTMKALASVANTYGKPRVGAEAFTGSRAWGDHPWLIKGMGDEAFAQGINHFIYHLSAHQPYDHMVPGLTHRKWGQHFHRHQTWWEFSKPYFDYIARSQTLLRQGKTVVDFACLYHEGAPLNIMEYGMTFDCPPGYDYDFCSPEIIQSMEFKNGRIHLPSGVSYRYLVLPKTGRLTLETAQKVEVLRKAGASIYQQTPVLGTPGLEGYPEADEVVREMAKDWPIVPEDGWESILVADKLMPDFKGEDLHWLHRRSGGDDIYFVANAKAEPIKRNCTFRVQGKTSELWDSETGKIFALSDIQETDYYTSIPLQFEASQSWFVVFRDRPTSTKLARNPFPSWKTVQKIDSKWTLRFDPDWGSKETLKLDTLDSWSEHSDPLVKYYSGTGTYRTVFDVPESIPFNKEGRYLDLGKVAVVASVKLNEIDCGTVWKPPYRIDISNALQTGRNELVVEVANTWVNRLIGDEQLPLDSEWRNWETLLSWPQWFKEGKKRPSGRYTLTSARHYTKDSPLHPAGLLGPVRILSRK